MIEFCCGRIPEPLPFPFNSFELSARSRVMNDEKGIVSTVTVKEGK
jgi:hypothetical protein